VAGRVSGNTRVPSCWRNFSAGTVEGVVTPSFAGCTMPETFAELPAPDDQETARSSKRDGIISSSVCQVRKSSRTHHPRHHRFPRPPCRIPPDSTFVAGAHVERLVLLHQPTGYLHPEPDRADADGVSCFRGLPAVIIVSIVLLHSVSRYRIRDVAHCPSTEHGPWPYDSHKERPVSRIPLGRSEQSDEFADAICF
jgi:hypothetical protein